MSGPQRARLDQALTRARAGSIEEARTSWETAARTVNTIADVLADAAGRGEQLGGRTGRSMFLTMRRTARMLREDHARKLERGARALRDSSDAVGRAEDDRARIDADLPPYQTVPFHKVNPDAEFESERERREAVETWDRQQSGFAATRDAERERRARAAADRMERGYDHPITVMKEIYGYRDPEPSGGSSTAPPTVAPPSGGGTGGGQPPLVSTPNGGTGGTGGTGTGSIDPGGDRGGDDIDWGDSGDDDPWTGGDLGGDGDGGDGGGFPDPTGTGDPGDGYDYPGGGGETAAGEGGGSGIPTGVVAGAAGAGGAAAAFGLVRSGAAQSLVGRFTGATPTTPGGTARSAVSGTLGRSAGATTGATPGRGAGPAGTGAGARSGGTGAGAGRPGGRAGSHGAAGSRAGGAGGAGGRGRGKDRGRPDGDRDLHDDGDDWIDDEDAAPGVLG
ncbi:MAG: hypothetical protein CMH83_10520 [Nocardioides sp.]|nr:hypothetical protein [Nocardioides sp.]